MGIRNWFDDNLMIVESNEKNTPFFCHDSWLQSGALCDIFRRNFELYQNNSMPFKEIRRLGLDEGGDDVIEFFLE